MSGSVSNSSGVILSTRQTYDSNNQLTGQQWRIGTTNYSESYTYSKTTGLLATHKPAVGNTLTYGYDGLQRLSSVTGGVYDKEYYYWDGDADNTTTTQVSQLYYDLPTAITYTYGYDDNGNIIAYMVNGSTTYYTYDAQNQLLKQTGGGDVTYEYSYDAAGNILTAKRGTETHTYAYENTTWRDLLTKFDGQSITYDNAGNPTSYYNGARWTMTWAEGRRLVSASGDGKSLTFTYDSDGLRLTKKVGNTTYQYYYAGGKLLRQTGGGNTLDFFYDASGNPYALKYNNTLYYYITNLQSDVLKIVDTSGNPVVTYSYDPYGKPADPTGDLAATLGEHNPLRYRGYVYDTEIGLYYLQSRYYDPIVGRFINPDGYISTGQGIIEHNMFVYCLNNPINGCDPFGTFVFPIAEELLEIWLEGDGSDQHYDEDSKLSRKLRRQKKIKDIYMQALASYQSGESKDAWGKGSVYLGADDSLDLFLAIRWCVYEIEITEERRTVGWFNKREQVKYTVTITVSDTYNFDNQKWDSAGNVLNNIARISHEHFDVGEDYQWKAVVTYETGWENVK